MRKVLQIAFAVAVVASLAQAAWHHGQLPERVAAHFDLSGRPNGWMSRTAHLGWHVGLVIFIAGLVAGGAKLMRKLPVDLVNLPHRDYWLAPERRDETFGWFAAMLQVLGVMLLAFFAVLFQGVFQLNVHRAERLSFNVAGASVVLVVSSILAVVLILRRFRRPPGR